MIGSDGPICLKRGALRSTSDDGGLWLTEGGPAPHHLCRPLIRGFGRQSRPNLRFGHGDSDVRCMSKDDFGGKMRARVVFRPQKDTIDHSKGSARS